MAIFKYTLPSGNKFTLTASEDTTQAQADKIFYEQVAAGTLVGYKKGDKLTHPQAAINEFGISRLKRGTAGVDDKTLLAVISGLPLVVSLPTTVAQAPVKNPINQVDYIQVTSNPTGRIGLKPNPIGILTSTQVQALMAGVAATVNDSSSATVSNKACVLSQETGVGSYGFNAQQLEQVGYIKPGYSQRYCPIDPNTGANPNNFVEFMQSSQPWTGKHGVLNVSYILCNQALQNTIQEELLNQSYTQLVSNGTIVPPPSSTTVTTVNTGQVYDTTGTIITASTLALLSVGLNSGPNGLLSQTSLTNLGNTVGNALSSLGNFSLGDIPNEIQSLGSNAIASFSSGLSSLSTGAVGFATSALNNISSATGSAITQLSGLATGLGNSNVAGTIASISSTVTGDIGALLTTGSKYGTELATAWANNASSTLTSIGSNLGSLASGVSDTAQNAFNTAQTSLTNGMDSLAKASQFSINFSDFSLSNMVAGVQPAAGFTNTVDRAVVDAAVNRVIGSPLIEPPTFALPSTESLGTIADINTAKNLLAQAQSQLQNIGSKVVNIV